MKLTKKQLSASYVTKATVATGRWATDDVANHRDSRLDRCSVARTCDTASSGCGFVQMTFGAITGSGAASHARTATRRAPENQLSAPAKLGNYLP
jgi:hypothetical protein